MNITDNVLDNLRSSVKNVLSDFRRSHTEGVERMAARLARIYAPERENEMRAAALLHDVTKEKKTDEQIAICNRYKYELRKDEIGSPAILHAITASLIIPDEHPDFATDEIISAVRWHTTGRENMSLFEKIIYLADYIEETRKYEECIALRNMFFDAMPEKMTAADAEQHLDRVIWHSLDMTVKDIESKGGKVCAETIAAKEYFENNLKI
jgi:nicotinate-nucleotide adenylyltransferase